MFHGYGDVHVMSRVNVMNIAGGFESCLGSVVQSIVSLTTSLRRKLVNYIPTILSNTLLFLLKNCENLFLTFFQQKKQCICDIYFQNVTETLTYDVVNFEQPGPGWLSRRQDLHSAFTRLNIEPRDEKICPRSFRLSQPKGMVRG